jgi:ribonuclease HII
MISPTMDFEERWWREGFSAVAGVDEVGRGAWAGPVVAAAVIVTPRFSLTALPDNHRLRLVRDSKLLPPKSRQEVNDCLRHQAEISYCIAESSVLEIDRLGISAATFLAMERALAGLPLKADGVLIDGSRHPSVTLPQQPLIKGDQKSFSIAAASILAKVHRDTLMGDLDSQFPHYAMAVHKGYGTARHRDAIRKFGLCDIHRRGFRLPTPLA